MHPSFETVRELLRACGFDLWYRLLSRDDSYAEFVDRQLDLDPEARVRDALARERVYAAIRDGA